MLLFWAGPLLVFGIHLLGWLFGQWRLDLLLALAMSGPFMFVGIIAVANTSDAVEDAKNRKQQSDFADQLRRAQWGTLESMVYVGAVYMVQDSERRPAGIKVDLAEAESWFKRAADKRYPRAYYWLGWLYLKQGRNEEAKLAINMGAAAGDPPSIHLLGALLLSDKLYEKNLAKATELLETAAARGNVAAKIRLGKVLLRNRKGSRIWFRGFRMFVGAIPTVFMVLYTEGFGSDRLR